MRRFGSPYSRTIVLTVPRGESRTKQASKDETDINFIMKKYARTGLLEHVNQHKGDYGDFTRVPENYHEAMNVVAAANEMFLTVPAAIREEFANDPGRFLEFVENPENEDRMREIGLLPSKRAAEQPPVRKEPTAANQPAEGSTTSESAPEGAPGG